MPDPEDDFARDVKAILLIEEAREARKRAHQPEIQEGWRLKDWADMASYLLPMIAMTGLYLDNGGSGSGAVAVALITAFIVGVLHYLNSFRTEEY